VPPASDDGEIAIGGQLTLIVYVRVSEHEPSVARMVNVKEPTCDGVPAITLSRTDIPGGTLPLTVQVGLVKPLTVNVTLPYDLPNSPSARVAGEMFVTGQMTIVYPFVPQPRLASVTRNVGVNVPSLEARPESLPLVPSSVTPSGSGALRVSSVHV
jgi:hypothetical protein